MFTVRSRNNLFFKYLLAGILFLLVCNSYAQSDTLSIYRKLKQKAYKHKATKLLYHAIFVDPAPEKYEQKPLAEDQRRENPDLKYRGKTIRRVIIEVYDPFGYSVNDTNRRETNGLQKAANRYHITTRHWVIEDLLLFGKKDTVDLLAITESERILRSVGYINDARIFIMPTKSRDSVDVKVLVHDKWTVVVPVVVSTSGARVILRDRNLLGLGQRFEQTAGYNARNGTVEFAGKYSVANISNTYISSDLYYTKKPEISQAGVSFSRPFYSPLAKWAGGLEGNKTWAQYKYIDTPFTAEKITPLDYYYYDVWGAKSFPASSQQNTDGRSSNIILGLRQASIFYSQRPSFAIDSLMFNINSSLYLGSIGFSVRKFYKDQYIFRFGANEDIPEGFTLQWLYGIEQREIKGMRHYTGFEISRGKHVEDFGYVSANVGYGTFFNRRTPGNATWNAGLLYFTNLIPNGEWYFRQFVNYKLTYGINKTPYERIALSQNELYGFRSGPVNGYGKMVLNLETVAYTPYNIIGFRFAPVILMGFGVIENEQQKFFKGTVYQSYALGILIRNENLLTSSFQVSFGFYPNSPDAGAPAYKYNPLTTFTLRVRSFSIDKPHTVAFQ